MKEQLTQNTILLDGKVTSAAIKLELATEVATLISQGKRAPHLCAILVGNNGASETYVASKVKNCAEVGFKSSLIRYDLSVSEEELLGKIQEINDDSGIDGLIVQLPLPDHFNVQRITEAISPLKDVDGFHPLNLGRMVQNLPAFLPATPYGILLMIEHYKIETSGKHCVVLGRSNIVGMPMSILLSRNAYPGNCTVTLCHSKTKDLEEILKSADIIIAALGKAEFLRANMVKEGAVVIDVGITRVKSDKTKSGFKIVGDVNFEEVAPHCSYISPVPGGVGLMTIVGLLKNTLTAYHHE
ncbi:MAG: bifunctional 5,10-methylene-tetrahydrofolate dehydrogenase/5,10-methylene-tetrahydrofolate cyclohydrolase [Bacteroidetes bacterium]|nr:MAG: bifunctional 5,10-methylene-tetrahydrofolate dehydrogenase/5,10-methylene-tetrahydrofolate cyclohydrolase [Bacteroidota bacterium]